MKVEHDLAPALIPALFLVLDLAEPGIVDVRPLVLLQAEAEPLELFHRLLQIIVGIGFVLQIVQMLHITDVDLVAGIFFRVIPLADNPKQDVEDIILPSVKVIPCLNDGLGTKCHLSPASFFLTIHSITSLAALHAVCRLPVVTLLVPSSDAVKSVPAMICITFIR